MSKGFEQGSEFAHKESINTLLKFAAATDSKLKRHSVSLWQS